MLKKSRLVISLVFLTCFLSSLLSEPVTPENPGKAPIIPGRPSVALVLAGGGAKGYAHIPILEMIEELDIPIDMVIGASAGAIVGGLYSAGYTPQEIKDVLIGLNWTPLFNNTAVSPYEGILEERGIGANPLDLTFGSDLALHLGKGFSSGQNVYQLFRALTIKLPSNIDFDDLPIPFRAMGTNMLTGDAEVLQDGDIAEAIRCSMSIPGIFEPFNIGDKYYVDGGLRYNLPINVVKNMGYDIIIAVDISEGVKNNPNEYNSNPSVAFLQMITISQATTNAKFYRDANIIIKPDTTGYSILSFPDSEKIYVRGQEAAKKNRENLENIRKIIYPNDYSILGTRKSEYKKSRKSGAYSEMDYLNPSSITITGEASQDEKYITEVSKDLLNTELTPSLFDDLINRIYMTGNYLNIIPRSLKHDDKIEMDIRLIMQEQKTIKVLLGGSLTQTLADDFLSKLSVTTDAQIRGFTGIGSVFSARVITINDFGVSAYYLQPFSPNFFLELESEYFSDKYATTSINKENSSVSTYYQTFKNTLRGGGRTNKGNMLKLNCFVNWSNIPKESTFTDRNLANIIRTIDSTDSWWENLFLNATIAGGYLMFQLDKQNSPTFASNGLYLDTIGKVLLPLNPSIVMTQPSCIISINVREAIELNKNFTLQLSTFLGSEVTSNMLYYPEFIFTEGFTTYDRYFFPQITVKKDFGIHKVAGMIGLQYQPKTQLTILGGQFVLQTAFSFGNVAYSYPDLIAYTRYSNNDTLQAHPILWSAFLGAGIRIKNLFSLFLRVGAGATANKVAIPFVAFDIGTIKF